MRQWGLESPTADILDEGGRSGGNLYLHHQEAEHNGPLHSDSDCHGPLSGGIESPRGMVSKMVVGKVGVEYCGRKGCLGGGRDGRGRRM